jgi:hypothetical protein
MHGWLPTQAIHFIARERRGHYLVDAGVISIDRSKKYDPAAPTSAASLENDWTVLTLDRDVGAIVGVLPLMSQEQIHSLPVGSALVHAGYSQDRAHILTKHEGCMVLAVSTFMLRHNCDAWRFRLANSRKTRRCLVGGCDPCGDHDQARPNPGLGGPAPTGLSSVGWAHRKDLNSATTLRNTGGTGTGCGGIATG